MGTGGSAPPPSGPTRSPAVPRRRFRPAPRCVAVSQSASRIPREQRTLEGFAAAAHPRPPAARPIFGHSCPRSRDNYPWPRYSWRHSTREGVDDLALRNLTEAVIPCCPLPSRPPAGRTWRSRSLPTSPSFSVRVRRWRRGSTAAPHRQLGSLRFHCRGRSQGPILPALVSGLRCCARRSGTPRRCRHLRGYEAGLA